MRGAASNYGVFCGALCVSLPELPTRAGWHMGAALSFKPFLVHIILFMVAFLLLVLVLVRYVFIWPL